MKSNIRAESNGDPEGKTDYGSHRQGRKRETPDYRKYLSSEILYIPHNSFAPQTALKNKIKKLFYFFRKSPKIPSKGHARARNLVEFKEKFSDNLFHNYADKRRNTFFQIYVPGLKHRYPCTQSGGGGCPKIVRHSDPITLLINTFGIHLEPGRKTRGKINSLPHCEECPKTSHRFSLFSRRTLRT